MMDVNRRTYVEIRDPNCAPVLKGPFPPRMVPKFLREAMDARPYSYLSVISIFEGGVSIEDGPQYLQIADGRSMNRARAHIKRTHRPTPTTEPQQ